jgi:glycosyltransferase involved in cell wall biosynthesis
MISIVIPVLNEENAIASTIAACKRIVEVSGNKDSEIIVVDDASEDRTPEIASGSDVKYIRHIANNGYGRSLKDGILAANNDIIVICDADGTYPVEKIPYMVELFGKGNDMVVGQRQWAHYKESFLKRTARKILKKIVEFAANKSISDINSGLRVFSKKEIIRYFPDLCNTFSFTTSLTLNYLLTERTIAYLPAEYQKRKGKTKVRIIKDSWITLRFVFRALKKYKPAKIWLLALLMLTVVGFACTVISLLWFPFNMALFVVCTVLFLLTVMLLIVILHQRKT